MQLFNIIHKQSDAYIRSNCPVPNPPLTLHHVVPTPTDCHSPPPNSGAASSPPPCSTPLNLNHLANPTSSLPPLHHPSTPSECRAPTPQIPCRWPHHAWLHQPTNPGLLQ